ncbi:hypothetical protein DY926_15765 [Komagataeibacter melaceti]|uniref:Uncharacterized protein n=1 Tax=Komagataeibacter melaceti TaxID=2766577 RepID=A0A371YWH4_9PROT|nr:hypothetical protein [Komagataeibacter melaceti]RFD18596.1 hypothetical protein DY926_15765 [Komagataeibacter melaceti]
MKNPGQFSVKINIWGIRGISADVRQAVITQSQKQGMKAGEWLTVAILEKIKQDRNAGKALVANNGKPAVSAEDASAVFALLERLQGMGIEPPERMKKQAIMMVRRCISSKKLNIESYFCYLIYIITNFLS